MCFACLTWSGQLWSGNKLYWSWMVGLVKPRHPAFEEMIHWWWVAGEGGESWPEELWWTPTTSSPASLPVSHANPPLTAPAPPVVCPQAHASCPMPAPSYAHHSFSTCCGFTIGSPIVLCSIILSILLRPHRNCIWLINFNFKSCIFSIKPTLKVDDPMWGCVAERNWTLSQHDQVNNLSPLSSNT